MAKQFLFVNADGDYEQYSLNFPDTDGSAGQTLITDASGNLTFQGHDDLAGFVAAEHYDWSSDISGTATIDNANIPGAVLTDGTRSLSGVLSYSGTPSFSNDNDIITKLYVDNIAQGLNPKDSVKASSTDNLTLSGEQIVDGISLVVGDRTLVKNQTNVEENGIYVVASGSWTRASDANEWDKIVSAFVFVEEGTVNADTGWVCTADTGGTLGTTGLPWSQFSGAGSILAGDGLTKTGDTFSVNVDDITIEINSDNLRIKADGVNNTHIDFGTGVNQVSAEDVPIEDTGTLISATDVEGALAENRTAIDAIEDNTITGGNGITSTGTIGADNLSISADVDGTSLIATGGTGAQLGIADNGVNDTHIDWGSGTNEVDASDVPLDTGGSWAGTAANVQDALEELELAVGEGGSNVYTAGNNISKGDLLYVSSTDTASTYSTITTAQLIIGVAADDATTGNDVEVLADDNILDGFTGLTAGTRYFWTGSGYTANFSSFSSGESIWSGGVAKNATNVHIETQFLMKKA